ncbi:MAG: metallophosphoesterase family protein [Bacteroidales bacterium]|nr:metallophosphoesterase family protein [Bacteroidales bacterium]
MKKMLFILAFLLGTLCTASAGNLLYGPWVHDVDEHGFTVVWVTEKPSLDFVTIAPDDGTAFEAKARPRYYETYCGRRVTGRYHKVRIDSLAPGTAWRYRIVGQVLKDGSPYKMSFGPFRKLSPGKRECVVRTFDASADTCRFSMFNDIHFNDARYTALAKPVDPKKCDFLCLCGDIVSYSRHIDTAAKHSIMPIAEKAEKLPLVFARGNHEGRGIDFYKFGSLFPTSTGTFYYSFRHGPAAFIVLDAGEDKPDSSHEYAGTADYDSYRAEETKWLQEAVKDPAFVSAPVKVCLIHVPTFALKDSWYSQLWITKHWTPILEKAGIDLMLCGHHHKWILSEAGQDGHAYPLLVNSNEDRMDVVISAHSIDIKTFDEKGTLTHSWQKEK